MNFKKSNLLVPPQYVFLLMFALFALLSSGGCGSSSDNNTSYIPSDANSVLTGAWRYTSGTVTATLGGTAHNLTVQNFAAYFGDCNVEDEDGTATFAAVAPLKG